MLAALLSVLTIFLVLGAGFLFARRGIFGPSAGELFPRTVIHLALPAMMLVELTTNFQRGDLLHAGRALVVPAAATICTALIAPWVARLAGVAEGRRGTFAAMFTASNTIFIGMPVNLALFGHQAVPSVLLAYAVNVTYFWTFGAHAIEGDTGRPLPIFSKDHLSKILTPPFLAFLGGVAMVLLGLRLPGFLHATLKMLGAMTTPLSLLFMGVTFAGISLRELRPSRDMAALFLGRFLLAPALVYAFHWLLPLPPLMVKVFMLQAAMPAITQAALVARTRGADHRYATILISATNLASLAVLPLYMALFTRLF